MKQHLVGGQWTDATRGEAVTAPYTGEVLGEVALASPDQLEAAISAAHRAAPTAAALPTWRRIEILRAIAAGLEARAEALATTISQEAAKPIDYARGEVGRAVQTFGFAADELVAQRGDVLPLDAAPKGEGKWGLTRRFPVGPILAITPFNFPLNLAAHKVAPAIAAGCPVVLKPANKTPLTALMLAEAVLESGWPPEALSVMNVAVDDAEALVRDDRFRALSFTGSDAVGWHIKRLAGRKPCLLELGGDAAVIVAEDATDLDAIAARVAFGAFAYAGQVCISVQRVLVHARHHEAFLAALTRATTETVRVGAPDQTGVMMSCLIDDRAAAKVGRILQETVTAGATVHTGGQSEGRRFEPTVLSGVPDGCPMDTEEVFGPVVHVAPFATVSEALARVNRSRFGLQAGIFTDRLATATRAFENLEVGAVTVNEVPTFRVDHMPYGGVKDSGLGREGLRHAFEAFTEPRLLVLP
ncbi:MAG: aldehyde dehydrogenase family protein, partial [Myxococcota bacterium]|nr:aldehyde dehydrogenase family protein [Myxococcota bacterium]